VLCRYDVTFEMNTNLTRTEIEEYRTYLRKVVNHRTPANGEDLVEDLTEKCENDQADSFATRTLRRAIAYTIASSIRPTKTARMLALDAIQIIV
jgi:hypothetical protein